MDKLRVEIDLSKVEFPESFYQMIGERVGDIVAKKIDEAVTEKTKQLNKARTMYTRVETAQLLRVSLTTLDKLRDDGALHAETAGRKVLYSQFEIDRYLNRDR